MTNGSSILFDLKKVPIHSVMTAVASAPLLGPRLSSTWKPIWQLGAFSTCLVLDLPGMQILHMH